MGQESDITKLPNEANSRIKEKVRALPNVPGVYLMKDRFGNVMYVGKAKDLKKRVSSYFQPSRKKTVAQPKVRSMLPLIKDVEIIEVKSEAEALLLEGKLLKEYKPRYNTEFVDDKRFLMVKVDVQNILPFFRLARNRNDANARYYGPFVRAGMLKSTLAEMRLKFGILLDDAKPVEVEPGRYKLYDDVRQEIYGENKVVSVEEYRERVEKACSFLEGKSREWIGELSVQMQEKAQAKDFEGAAELRDVIQSMKHTLERTRKFASTARLQPSPGDALDRLGKVLDLDRPPTHLECFDISHISGSFVVASMVCFHEGKPSRKDYRRYKIKGFVGNDDFLSMEEVVGRRYRRLNDEGLPLPDLIVIDGGKGQVRAAQRAFLILDIPPPPLIGLAKREETIIFPDERPPLQLEHDDHALFLLQRARDEAHRFANQFNADLRSKKIRESILDEFEGMGKVRKKTLMKHFRSLQRLQKATEDEIRTVPGFGPQLSKELFEFLHPKESKNKKSNDLDAGLHPTQDPFE
ncbi:MAG: excinuclease ABC subunit UvrC [Opitutales bacterium]|nr:excinuclease ABC subunit UvrC [Opitutales bacterium]